MVVVAAAVAEEMMIWWGSEARNRRGEEDGSRRWMRSGPLKILSAFPYTKEDFRVLGRIRVRALDRNLLHLRFFPLFRVR